VQDGGALFLNFLYLLYFLDVLCFHPFFASILSLLPCLTVFLPLCFPHALISTKTFQRN
jgi:hypothetical protein